MTTIELKQERQGLLDEARTILDTVDTEKRALSEDENKKYEDINSKIDELTDTIAKREKIESFEVVEARELPSNNTVVEKRETSEEMDIRELGEAIKEKRDYTAGMNSGAFINTTVDSNIRAGIQKFSRIRQISNVSSVSGNLVIPVDGGDVSVGIVGEGGTYSDGGGTLTSVEFKPIKVGSTIKFTDEALADVPANLVQNATVQVQRAIAAKENLWFVSGNGTSEPEGVLTGASEGIVTSGTTAITGKELNGLINSLDDSLIPYATMVMAPATLAYLQDLTDKNKGYNIVWDSTSNCFRVNGIPVIRNANMPAIGTGNKAIVIGDFQNFYEIKDRTGFEVKVLDQLYATEGKIGYRFTFRTDAHVMDSEAFKYLQLA